MSAGSYSVEFSDADRERLRLVTGGDVVVLMQLVDALRARGATRITLPSGFVIEFAPDAPAHPPEPLETIDDAKAEKERKSELARALHV